MFSRFEPARRSGARASACLAFVLLLLDPWHAARAFGFEDVQRLAQGLAAKSYAAPAAIPKALRDLTYDQYRDIRNKPSNFLWHGSGLPVEVAFFHLGWHYLEPVRIHVITRDGVRDVRFDPRDFDYGNNTLDTSGLAGIGFGGFRVHYALNRPRYKDEVLVFLGASYFRALGKGQHYGLSARGLAIDTGLASGEEFPRFTEFWIQRPARGAKTLTIYALLDSKRAAGAYRFVLRPGGDTTLDVRARLYLRAKVGKLGLAPLTSMFLHGANQRAARDDYRPEVHDSDGLSIHAGDGEWLWRPLVDPARLLVSSFSTQDPLGFGLMQRERRFSRYEDLEAHYERRPSAWVEPWGPWGAGRIELVALPTSDETNDNIVAYWVPDSEPAPQQPYDFAYILHWQGARQVRPPTAWVAQTRRGRGYVAKPDGDIGFKVDFKGPALDGLPASAPLAADVWTDANAKVTAQSVERSPIIGGARLALRIRRLDVAKPVEMRAVLKSGERVLSETWTYLLPPTK